MPVELLSILLPAAAEAVISYALGKLNPADRVREWLKRDPARLAYQKALARAYAAFARQYPDLTASLFNESFLKTEAVPELAKQLTRHRGPDPSRLAESWANSIFHLNSDLANKWAKDPTVVRAAADFLHWLQSELKAESAFQPLFDSRALESLPDIEAKLDILTEELRRMWDAARTTAEGYERSVVQRAGVNINAQGDMTIGGSSVTTANIYNYFLSGDFAALDEFYVRPDDVFPRVRVDEFVGREWLEAEVEGFIHEPARASGALVIIGDAGVGKTSFAAHLVRKYGYPHLFADNVGGEVKLPLAIRSLSAQLISRHRIEPYASRDALPTEPSQFDTFLSKVLRLAAETLTHGEKIVIVCDALDEAGTAPGGNVFGLPKQLPDGAYFILTRRPAPAVKLDMEPRPRPLMLEALGEENLRDVRVFLLGKARTPAIAGQLAAQTESQFVETLTQKSEGLWIYLKHVLDEITQGLRAPLDLAKLPSGLTGYYAEHWRDWREGRNRRGEGRAAWNRSYAPLLCTLAAAHEPMPAGQFAAWAGIEDQECEALLMEHWRPFLRKGRRANGEYDYTLYHASLREFLTERRDGAEAQPEEEWISHDLVRGVPKAHNRIVGYYRAQAGGDWPKLVDDDYARRYLTAHLAGAGRHAELFALVAESNAWAEARYVKEGDYAGYLNDLELAWRWAESGEWHMGRQIRCALIESSIRSLAGNISPELLSQVVGAGLRSPAWALAHIPQIPHERQRAEALGKIASYLPSALKADALQAARAITNEQARAEVLNKLAPHLPDPLKAEALQAARAIRAELARARALSELAPHLPDPLRAEAWQDALQAARAIRAGRERARALSELAPHLPDPLKAEALQAVRAIRDREERARALSELAPHLPDPLKAEAWQDALQAARAIRAERARARALSELAPHLPDPLKAEAWQGALQAARAISDERERAEALSRLAPHLPDPLKAEAWQDAWQAARAIRDEWARAEALNKLAPYLPDPLRAEIWQDALQAARAITNEQARAEVLNKLAPHLKVGFSNLDDGRKLWPDTLRTLARHRRAELLNDLAALAPLIEHLGGADATGETYLGIRDVTRWWP